MKEKRLPQNTKEELLYGGLICLITVIVMLILNVGTSMGTLNKEAVIVILKLIPIIWLVALLIEALFVGKISEKLCKFFLQDTDSFNTRILFNILFCVTGMSAIMTIVGNLIASGISFEPFSTFASHWPRNFFVAFWCEVLLAQPTARFVMKQIHSNKSETKQIAEKSEEIEEAV